MPNPAPSLYDFRVTAIDGTIVPLSTYRGRVLLIVNVASRCGYTPQYRGLESLYRQYQERGLVVLGFPCDQFGHQEPGTDAEIRRFCSDHYDVTFPLFHKVRVNGAGTHPLYVFLKSERRGWLGTGRIKWNFTKFLVDRSGTVVRRFGPATTPESMGAAIGEMVG
jgi:glutathione peroxidase